MAKVVYIVAKGWEYEGEDISNESCKVFLNKKKAEKYKEELSKEYCDYVLFEEKEIS